MGIQIDELLNKVADRADGRGQQKEARSEEQLVEEVLGKEAAANAPAGLKKEAAEFAKWGKNLADQQVNKVAKVRKTIADKYGADTLNDLDKVATFKRIGQSLAEDDVKTATAVKQEQDQVKQAYNEIEREYDKETADDVAKLAYFKNVGENLAQEAIASGLTG